MQISKKYLYLLSFLLPLGVMIGVLVCFGVQPFGDNSLLIIDGLHQYMPFFSILYDKLKGGESLFYSFRAGLGINFLSLFSYYLSSPLNLFILLFQKTQLNMAVSLLVVLKIALSGLTAGIYFTSKTKKPGLPVLVAAMAYALNSYMVGYCWNVMWLDAIMIFPIIIMGIERLIDKKDGRMYCLALFYALYCNYYIAFMICIFSVIWYLFYSFQSVKQFFFRGIAFAFYSFLAAGMSAVLLIPAYLGIKQTASGDAMQLPEHGWETGFADLLTRQFDLATPISHDNFDGNANLYLGMFAVLALFLYLLNREIHWLRKLKVLVLTAFFYVSFSENILNFIWHGFHNQYGIPNRFSFLLGFVLIAVFFQLMEHKEGIRNWHIVLGCLAGTGLLYVSRTLSEEPLSDGMYGVAGMLLLLYGMLLFIMTIDRKRQSWYAAVFCLAAVVEIGATALVGFEYNGQISVSKFFSGTEDMEEAVDSLSDGTFYRSELADAKMVDENAWYRLNAVGLFGSTAMDHMVNMMDSLGFYTGCNEYLYRGGTPVSNLMLGVRYLYYHPEDQLHTDFEYKDTFGEFDVYENQTKGLSIGYMIDNGVENWYYESAYPFRVLNDFGFTGYGTDDVFKAVEITDPVTRGCTAEQTNDGEYYFTFEESDSENMVFTIPIRETTDEFFVFYDGTQVENAEIALDGEIILSDDVDGQMLPLGPVNAGSLLTVKFELKGETENGYVRLSAAAFQREVYEELAEAMTSGRFEITKMNDRMVEGKVTSEEDQQLFFSIPYDSGWTATVDGKKVSVSKLGEAFLAIPLSAGEHDIRITYTPNGFRTGLIISVVCALLFILCCIRIHEKRRKKPKHGRRRRRKMRENQPTPPDNYFPEFTGKTQEMEEDEKQNSL